MVSIDLNHVCLIARVNLNKVGGDELFDLRKFLHNERRLSMNKGAILRQDPL